MTSALFVFGNHRRDRIKIRDSREEFASGGVGG